MAACSAIEGDANPARDVERSVCTKTYAEEGAVARRRCDRQDGAAIDRHRTIGVAGNDQVLRGGVTVVTTPSATPPTWARIQLTAGSALGGTSARRGSTRCLRWSSKSESRGRSSRSPTRAVEFGLLITIRLGSSSQRSSSTEQLCNALLTRQTSWQIIPALVWDSATCCIT